MKKIVTLSYYNIEDMKQKGFKTDRQIGAIVAISDLLETIKNIPEDFAFMAFLIKDKDLFDKRQVEVLSNMTDAHMIETLENHCLARLKLKKDST